MSTRRLCRTTVVSATLGTRTTTHTVPQQNPAHPAASQSLATRPFNTKGPAKVKLQKIAIMRISVNIRFFCILNLNDYS
ncbi:hypothetical protein Glove_195g20 [Diversispora epigaea]|uniref:Uncharacterized protein n=1 Tax=Diversispora epigaea TaxID=1348612 RepID=A0A397IP80_9GLOM|nr:hypothetical protein Glove_195g20 [Diversispora epigaea]